METSCSSSPVEASESCSGPPCPESQFRHQESRLQPEIFSEPPIDQETSRSNLCRCDSRTDPCRGSDGKACDSHQTSTHAATRRRLVVRSPAWPAAAEEIPALGPYARREVFLDQFEPFVTGSSRSKSEEQFS